MNYWFFCCCAEIIEACVIIDPYFYCNSWSYCNSRDLPGELYVVKRGGEAYLGGEVSFLRLVIYCMLLGEYS